MAEKKTSVSKRYRNFATIVYPESAPSDWQEILSSYHVPAFVSPLHDKDTMPDGSLKKAHYHVMMMYDGVKTRDQVDEVIHSFGGVGIEVVGSITGYARYLCHLDELTKVHYPIEQVVAFAGADYYHISSLAVDRYKALDEMCDYVVVNHIVSFTEFTNYCRVHKFEWFRLLVDNSTYFMDKFISRNTWLMNAKVKKDS